MTICVDNGEAPHPPAHHPAAAHRTGAPQKDRTPKVYRFPADPISATWFPRTKPTKTHPFRRHSRPGRNPYRRQKHPHVVSHQPSTTHPCGWHMMLLSFYHKVNGNRLLAAWQFPTWSSNGWYDGNDRNASKHHQNSIKTQKLPAQLSAKQTSVRICTVNIYIYLIYKYI